MNIKTTFTIAALAALLTACGKEAATNAAPSASGNASAPQTQSVETGSSSKPLTEYTELNSGRQLLAHFVARKELTADEWSQVAGSANNKISSEQDAFKRQDMVKEFRAAVEGQAQTAKGSSYVYFDFPDFSSRDYIGAHLRDYDFEKKGFPVPFLEARPKGRDSLPNQAEKFNQLGFLDDRSVNLEFTNPKQFQFMKVEDETLAREIEAKRKKSTASGSGYFRPDLHVRAYVFINGVMDSPMQGKSVTAQIMKLQLRDPQGKVLVEF